MWLSVFAVVFIGSVAYYQAIQGLTSAGITAVLSIFCLALSFATYEYVAEAFLASFMLEYANAVAFFAMFTVPLLVLRLVLDKVIPRSNLFPQVIEWVVGGAFGLLSGIVMTGVLTLSLQMVPWGAEGVIGFVRFNPQEPDEQNELWLKPDRAVVNMGAMLSSGAFSGNRPLVEDHPDLVTEVGLAQSQPRGVRKVVPPDSVKLTSAGRVSQVFDRVGGDANTPADYAPVDPKPGNVFTRVTLQLGADTADEDNQQRYTAAAVKLVGVLGEKVVSYHGIAVGDRETPHRQIRALVNRRQESEPIAGKLMTAPPNKQIDIVFEHPEAFQPRYVEYKIGGRIPMSNARINGAGAGESASNRDGAGGAPTTASSTSTPSGSGSGTQSGQAIQPKGRVSGVKFKSSHFGGDLPVTMTAYQGRDVDNKGDALIQGHLQGNLADQGETNSSTPIAKLEIPSGKSLLQLNVESLQAGSTLGKALNWSVQTVENYLLEDSNGQQYQPVGKYAIAKVGNDLYVEILYFPEYAQSGGRFGAFGKIKGQHLKGDYQLVYLFLVDPGTRVVKFSTGGNKRPIDLSRLNLVAP